MKAWKPRGRNSFGDDDAGPRLDPGSGPDCRFYSGRHKRLDIHLSARQARVSREAELNRVNDQLRLLYGPLYATLLAGDAAWQALSSSKHWPAHGRKGYFAEGFELSEQETIRWRTWMREVFTPNNERLEQIIWSISTSLRVARFRRFLCTRSRTSLSIAPC